VVNDMTNSSSSNTDVFLLQNTGSHCPIYLITTQIFLVILFAMSKYLKNGMLCDRPFGGVMILIKNVLRTLTENIYCDEHFAIVCI